MDSVLLFISNFVTWSSLKCVGKLYSIYIMKIDGS